MLNLIVFLIICSLNSTAGETRSLGLPRGAQIIEMHAVPGRANRALVLWMLRPVKHPLGYGPDEYTCPDSTRGSYYRGPTRISLIDSLSQRIINTVSISGDEDSFDVPYKIKQGLYYQVDGTAK